jgi:prepilin-type processing-associated H-X9-DG protein
MFCRNCGKAVADDAVVCASCGCPPRSGTNFCANCGAPASPAPEPERKTSRMAIAALILAIVPTCIGQLVAIGLAIGALVAIHRAANKLKGQGIAVAGLVIAVAGLVIAVVMASLAASTVPMAAMMLPAFARAREQAREARCRENLSKIGKAIHAFNEDNPGRFPSSLQELYPRYIPTFRVFRCPSTSDNPPAQMSYEYRQPPPNAAPHAPIAWDNFENHESGRNVLFADGSVRWFSEEDFQSLMGRQPSPPAAPAGP